MVCSNRRDLLENHEEPWYWESWQENAEDPYFVFKEVGFVIKGLGFEVSVRIVAKGLGFDVSEVGLCPFPLLLQLQVIVPGLSFLLLARVTFTLPPSIALVVIVDELAP